MNKKVIRLTESDLRKIVKESVNRILKEDYYSMKDPYGSRKLSDFSSDEAKALYDYDPGFAVSRTHRFDGSDDTFEPAALSNVPYNEPMFPEDEQPFKYWDAIKKFDDRHPIDPSAEDKAYQMDRDWRNNNVVKIYSDGKEDYNYNVHDDAFETSGAKGRLGRLNAFDDDFKGDKVRKFNGTRSSLRSK